MRPNRTPEQKRADRFDADLYCLVRIAEATADARGKDWGKWYAARTRLIQARLLVRDLMHPDDVKETS